MTMKAIPSLPVALVAMFAAELAHANPPRRALELGAQVGLGHSFGKRSDRSHELKSSNGGAILALGLAYRSAYLFVPWAECGWAALQWSKERAKSTEFADQAPSESKLSTRYVLVGPGFEAGSFRLRAGIGLYHTLVTSSFAGNSINPSTWDMGYFLAYGLRVNDAVRYGWGIEAMGLLMSETQLAYVGLALRVWGNAWVDTR